MTTFFFLLWLGGTGEAYRQERRHFGRVRAVFEAMVWPAGIGFQIVRYFYANEDWPR